jgi:hypothetical protein
MDVATSRGQLAKAPASKCVIRTRLTIRGFEDSERNDIDRYAGTSSRASQKDFVSKAVRKGWHIATQGVTYDELARLTGVAPQEVNFDLPTRTKPVGPGGSSSRKPCSACTPPGSQGVGNPLSVVFEWRPFSTKYTRGQAARWLIGNGQQATT